MTVHVRKIVATLSVSALMLTAGCGSKDDTSEESKGSPAVSSAPSETAAATPSAVPSDEPSASASPSSSAYSSTLGLTVSIELIKGKPEKLLDDVKLSKGDKFTLKATSDEAHEIHIHGYDKTLDIKPGEVQKVTFTADKTGSYVVEVEDTKTELFSLQVR